MINQKCPSVLFYPLASYIYIYMYTVYRHQIFTKMDSRLKKDPPVGLWITSTKQTPGIWVSGVQEYHLVISFRHQTCQHPVVSTGISGGGGVFQPVLQAEGEVLKKFGKRGVGDFIFGRLTVIFLDFQKICPFKSAYVNVRKTGRKRQKCFLKLHVFSARL